MTSPVVSAGGLTYAGYKVELGDNPVIRRSTKFTRLLQERGLWYLKPVSRSMPATTAMRRLRTSPSSFTSLVAANSSRTDRDYWKIENTSDGSVAVRVHNRPRKELYVPTMQTTYPGSDIKTDPWLHLLGPNRTTHVKFKDGMTLTVI